MEKEILFRGKDMDNEYQWRYGSLLQYPNGDCVIVILDKNNNELAYDVDPDTVGQYTGLDDSKGKHIYERDILFIKVLRADNYFEYNTDVVFEDGAFWIKGENTNDYDTLLYAYINPTSPLVELEVIGNIYDNHDILKGADE